MDLPPERSRDRFISIKRITLYQILLEKSTESFCNKIQRAHLTQRVIEMIHAPPAVHPIIKRALSRFISEILQKWRVIQRNHKRFLNGYKKWLESEIRFEYNNMPMPAAFIPSARERPTSSFSNSSERSKRRKTSLLRQKYGYNELLYASQMNLRAAGKIDAAKIIRDVRVSPNKASEFLRSYKKKDFIIPKLLADKALSMIIDAGLSTNQYDIIRSVTKEIGCNIFPSYEKIKEEKARCYPGITATEKTGEVRLQDLLDHTVERIILSQKEVLQQHNLTNKELCLISKWGCDGSSGHSTYKQKFENKENTDENLFLTSFVPLQLVTKTTENENKTIIWQNPRPSSPRFCRPIRFQFIHENTDVSIQEKNYIENQIKLLTPSKISLGTGEFNNIQHTMIFSMIDGKICNAVTQTYSTQRCYLCGLTSKNFNNINLVLKTNVDETASKFGLSTLHAWIRFFENLLHLSYKLSIKKWQARDNKDKQIVSENKKRIQNEFKCKMGLIVDVPKPTYGNSNDGNTARRFFNNPEMSAEITGLDINIINRFRCILQVISSGFSIIVSKFEKFTLDTAKMYIETYPWYYMSTTVHKILIHSPTVIASCILPIGMLSEEAQEARNKDIRKYREYYARKCSRSKNVEDVMRRLLISSDPYLSSLHKHTNKKLVNFSKDVTELLSEPQLNK